MDTERPAKRAKLLADDSASDDESNEYSPADISLKVNEEYARRFEHNKKRAELHRLEEKHGKSNVGRSQSAVEGNNVEDLDGSSSESESEDDEAVLVTEGLDAEISATLNAIKYKDPIVYDKTTTFYTGPESDTQTPARKEKPMYLRDYHRKNLLEMQADGKETVDNTALSYASEQEALRKEVIRGMHATVEDAGPNVNADSRGEDDFLVPKQNSTRQLEKQRSTKVIRSSATTDPSVGHDPETFLSNYMATRAWIPDASSRFQPFESDDDEEDRHAEAFEEAYNMRFEDPHRANEKLMSHSRNAAAKYSVRRDEASGRKRERDAQRARKEEEKREIVEERARLRKLKLEEAQEKLNKIKEAAALRGKSVSFEDWERSRFLEADWDGVQWEQHMNKLFGDTYYAAQDWESENGASEGTAVVSRTGKVKKPKWKDDIGIKDIVSDFEEEGKDGPAFTLSDGESDHGERFRPDGVGASIAENDDVPPVKKKDRLREQRSQKIQARKERRMIEQVVDDRLESEAALSSRQKGAPGFRYRETSPTSFGLTARDILFAEDGQLNEFVGLKKLAAFRDPEKKKRDGKKFSKKARLRQWRRETFGDEGLQVEQSNLAASAGVSKASAADGDVMRRQQKHKRSRKSKMPVAGEYAGETHGEK